MQENIPKCIKRVGALCCPICDGSVIKYGKSKSGKQRYQCKLCFKVFISSYTYKACISGCKSWIVMLKREGCGMRSISRLLQICCNTVQRQIKHLSAFVKKPSLPSYQRYEVDELCTYIGNKGNRVWIAYAYCRETKSVVDFVIGSRSKTTLQPLIEKLLSAAASTIYTDKHQTYTTIIPAKIHSTKYRGTNHIERKNLTLRTHLKRLGRRTICFSRSIAMLHTCLMIYFFA